MTEAGGWTIDRLKLFRTSRPTLYHVVVRPLVYVAALFVLLGMVAWLLNTASPTSTVSTRHVAASWKMVFYAALLAPIVETMLLALLFHYLAKLPLRLIPLITIFASAAVVIAWATHGMSVGAVARASLFFFCALFFARSKLVYRRSTEEAAVGTIVIHLTYNLPFVISTLSRLLAR